MSDLYEKYQSGLESPASRAFEIVPDDNTDLSVATRAVSVAETGFVRLTTINGDLVRIFVAAGVPFPIRAARIWSTDTTATGIVGMA